MVTKHEKGSRIDNLSSGRASIKFFLFKKDKGSSYLGSAEKLAKISDCNES